jgi:hypothetical protein
VALATPANAVVLALQHSGSLRYYSGRQTLDWDRIPAGELAASVRALESYGYDVYLMLDSQAERAMFEAKHGDVVNQEGWLPSGQRRSVQLYQSPSSGR